MFRRLILLFLLSLSTLAQQPTLSKTTQEYVRLQSPKVILTQVRIIDGTGAPADDDQNIVIESGTITASEKGADVAASPNVTVLDLLLESEAGPGRPPARQQVLDAMTVEARNDFLVRQRPPNATTPKIDPAVLWQHELALERAFVAAGGLLLSGPDPTGGGGCPSRVRRPAGHRAFGRGRILSGRSDQNRHAQRRRLSQTA